MVRSYIKWYTIMCDLSFKDSVCSKLRLCLIVIYTVFR